MKLFPSHLYVKCFCILFILYTSQVFLYSQSTKGTQFWCGFMENLTLAANDEPIFSFYVDADEDTNVTIEIPQSGFQDEFIATANSITRYTIPDGLWYSEGSENIDEKGIHISTNQPVSITAFHYRLFFSESTLLFPIEEMGSNYIALCYQEVGNRSPSSLVIVGTEDNTEIEIMPSVETLMGRPGGVAYTINLDRGQNYQLQSDQDLSGSKISSLSGQKIAVFSGSRQSFVEDCDGGADNHLWDQCVPIDSWSNDYFFIPFKDQGGDIIKILAANNNTTIFFDCQEEVNLNGGESYIVKLTDAIRITGSDVFALGQYNSSNFCNASNLGDPTYIRLLPTALQTQLVRFESPGDINALTDNLYFLRHYCNIITPTNAINDIRLDGVLVGDMFSEFSGNPLYSFAQINLNSGAHMIESDSFFAAISYGFGDFDSYGFHHGYEEERTPEEINSILAIDCEGTLCIDSLIRFSTSEESPFISWSWEIDNVMFSDNSSPSFTFDRAGSFTISIDVVDVNCARFQDSKMITIEACENDDCSDTTPIEIEFPEIVCIDSLIQFMISSDASLVDHQWSFSNGESFTSEAPVLQFNEENTISVSYIGKDLGGCDYMQDAMFEVIECSEPNPCFDNLTFEINIEGDLCIDSTIHLSSISDVSLEDYRWDFGNGNFSMLMEDSTTYNSIETFIVNAEALDSASCVYRGTKEIQISNCQIEFDCQVYFPNTFIPEESPNDEFKMFSNCTMENFSLHIYTRWGQLIFVSNIAAVGWNGLYNDEILPSGVYIWRSAMMDPNGNARSLSGNVTLLR